MCWPDDEGNWTVRLKMGGTTIADGILMSWETPIEATFAEAEVVRLGTRTLVEVTFR